MPTTGNLADSSASLYFHIPFCSHKCPYCHFYVLPDLEPSKDQLLEGFKLEWQRWAPSLKNKTIVSIYFGGGTPSLFGPKRLQALLEFISHDIHAAPDMEVTLEVNPENVTVALMKAYADTGVNRVSMGVQTLDNDLLKLLERTHDANKALNAIHDIHAAGISNISIDLMYDLPKQTLSHWEQTLDTVCQLPITHLSLYNLTIEPHTLFFKKQALIRKLIPDEATSLAMYEMAVEKLTLAGLAPYEISAFAKPSFQSRHNVGYWTARPFIGFGPSAFSYWEGKRFRNIANLNRYCAALQEGRSPADFDETLDPEAQRRELFVIRLRLGEGVDLTQFESRHGVLSQETRDTLQRLAHQGFLDYHPSFVKMTRKGILFYDTLAAELI